MPVPGETSDLQRLIDQAEQLAFRTLDDLAQGLHSLLASYLGVRLLGLDLEPIQPRGPRLRWVGLFPGATGRDLEWPSQLNLEPGVPRRLAGRQGAEGALSSAGVAAVVLFPLVSQGMVAGSLLLGSGSPEALLKEPLSRFDAFRLVAGLVASTLHRFLTLETTAESLARERDQQKFLLEISNILSTEREPRSLLRAINQAIKPRLDHDYLSLGLLDPDSDTVSLHFMDFPAGKGFLYQDLIYPRSLVPWASAFETGMRFRLRRADFLRGTSPWSRRFQMEGLRSLFCAPLRARGRVFGTLNFGSMQEDRFGSGEEQQLLERIAAQVALAVGNLLAYQELEARNSRVQEEKSLLVEEIHRDHGLEYIVGRSLEIRKVIKQVYSVAGLDATVLLLGETGTGKELLARALHEQSPRRLHPFVKVNCAAIPGGLMESELFGHEKGAFTGAAIRSLGRMELADQGTLFLDEVGEIPLDLQPKLMRAIQEKEFERLGNPRTFKVDFRLIAATNRDLGRMVEAGTFRSDLFYRLNVFPITVPPLRERVEDIPPLVRHFVRKYADRLGRPIESIPKKVMAALVACPWPGNIRELENFVERSVILNEGRELQVSFQDLADKETIPGRGPSLAQTEREAILEALKVSGGRVSGPGGAARRLGLPRTTLQARMKKLGIGRTYR
jgi:formate hydrogenlyase transcriptional activator